jgi:hypothetical protein
MFNTKNAKSAQFYECIICNFKCSKKSDWTRHVATRKHTSLTDFEHSLTIKNADNKLYKCTICNKIYNSRVGLWYHYKKCKEYIINESIKKENMIVDEPSMKNLILDIIKNNTDALKEIMDVCKNMNNTTNNNISNTNNTNNSNNKTFNLQVFLNEQCKDAMNLTDFISSIELNLSDLENMEKLGYTDCMFNNIFGNMNILDICSRPFHCSDLKREIMYIKDNDVWEKEDAEHSKLKNAIRTIEKKNFKLLNDWTNKHPTFKDYDSPYNDKYLKIVGQTMSGDKEHMDKVIRRLAKSCVIDKNSL